jgi:DNA-binding MarR family transcriptional regulator
VIHYVAQRIAVDDFQPILRVGYFEEADFVYIRQQTKATAGNLSVQIDKLSKAGYVEVTKTFKGKMPCTICKITPQGVDAFEEYVESLKSYLAGRL